MCDHWQRGYWQDVHNAMQLMDLTCPSWHASVAGSWTLSEQAFSWSASVSPPATDTDSSQLPAVLVSEASECTCSAHSPRAAPWRTEMLEARSDATDNRYHDIHYYDWQAPRHSLLVINRHQDIHYHDWQVPRHSLLWPTGTTTFTTATNRHNDIHYHDQQAQQHSLLVINRHQDIHYHDWQAPRHSLLWPTGTTTFTTATNKHNDIHYHDRQAPRHSLPRPTGTTTFTTSD